MIEVVQVGKGHKQHVANTLPELPPDTVEAQSSASSEEPPARMPPPNEQFAQMLEASCSRLRDDQAKRISKLIVFSERKVHELQTAPPKQYLAHILSVSQAGTQQKVLGLVRQRESQIEAAIFSSDLNIRKRPKVDSIRKREQNLAMKLQQIGREMQSVSAITTDDHSTNLSQIMEHRYWDPSSEGTTKAKEFVQRLRSQKRKARIKLRQLQSKSVQEMELKDKQEKEQQERLLKERINESVKKLLEYKKQREQQKVQREERRKEESELLQKYQVKNPKFLEREKQFEQEFNQRQEEERKRKLSEIKQKYRPLDNQELQEHAKNYEEFRVKMQEEIAKRLEEEKLINERSKDLQDLYHGHYHQLLAEESAKQSERRERGKSVQEKIAEYRESVLDQLKPRIDERKRKELEILKLQLEYKGKRVKKRIEENGDVVFEDLSPKIDHRKLGVQYLSDLRKMHSQMTPRKRTSQPAMIAANTSVAATASSESEKKNYLHQGTKGLKATLSNWKKDLNSNELSRDQKYDLVLKKVEVIDQQARQKEAKLRVLKDQPQALNVKESLDRHYLNSINAKLSVLNQVIYDK